MDTGPARGGPGQLSPGHRPRARESRAYLNLGNCLKDQGQLDDAIAAYRIAIDLDPGNANFHSTLILASHYHLRHDQRRFTKKPGNGIRGSANRSQPRSSRIPTLLTPTGDLRVGYVSPDFREHPASSSTIPLLANHNHQSSAKCFAMPRWKGRTLLPNRVGLADESRNAVGLPDEPTSRRTIRRNRDRRSGQPGAPSANSRYWFSPGRPDRSSTRGSDIPGTSGPVDDRLPIEPSPSVDPPGLFRTPSTQRRMDHGCQSVWCYDPVAETPPVNPLPALSNGTIALVA